MQRPPLRALSSPRNPLPILVGLLSVWAFAGCDRPEEIRTYEVPRRMPAVLKPSDDRMLAAMVPRGDSTWFFKVSGPERAVAAISDDLKRMVESLEFERSESDPTPILDPLPEGWVQRRDKPMRFATIEIPAEPRFLDLSVSRLSRQPDWDEEVLINVNRWRGQIGLEPSRERWAGAEPVDVAAADEQAVWVDLVGKMSTDATSMSPPGSAGPLAGAAPGPARQANSTPPTAPRSGPNLQLERPPGWRPGRSGGMRLAAFEVGPESSPTEITVITAGGDLRGNVQRWLGQVRSGDVPESVLDEAMSAAEVVDVDGRRAERFILTADPPESGDAIDATVVPLEGGTSLFIKMTGPYDIVSQESAAMREFLASIRL